MKAQAAVAQGLRRVTAVWACANGVVSWRQPGVIYYRREPMRDVVLRRCKVVGRCLLIVAYGAAACVAESIPLQVAMCICCGAYVFEVAIMIADAADGERGNGPAGRSHVGDAAER